MVPVGQPGENRRACRLLLLVTGCGLGACHLRQSQLKHVFAHFFCKTQRFPIILPRKHIWRRWWLWVSPGCLLGAPWVTPGCLLGAPGCLLGAPGCILGVSWVALGAPGCLLAAPGCSWLLLAAPGCSWLLLAAPGYSWLFLAVPGCCWLLLATEDN